MKREEQILVILIPRARGDRAEKLQENQAKLSPRAIIRCPQSPGNASQFAEAGQNFIPEWYEYPTGLAVPGLFVPMATSPTTC